MGKSEGSTQPKKSRSNKSKGRMSYLKRFRAGKGGRGGHQRGAKVDEHGQMYGDYAPAYGSKWGSNSGGKGRRPRETLKPGMIGFLCSTNFKEKECVREAYNILNEYNDAGGPKEEESVKEARAGETGEKVVAEVRSEGEEKQAADMKTEPQQTNEAQMDEEDEDIDQALANELKDLKSEKIVRKFQSVDTGVNNVVFISTTIENPTELAYKIFEDITSKQQTKSRHILRFLPIEMTCNSNNLDEVKSRAKDVIEKYLKTGYSSFKIVVNVRHNNKFARDDLIKSLADLVSEINPLTFVDLSNATYTLVVEVLKTTLCFAVVKDFSRFKKYNLLEAGTPPVPTVTLAAETEASTVSESVTLPAVQDQEQSAAEELAGDQVKSEVKVETEAS